MQARDTNAPDTAKTAVVILRRNAALLAWKRTGATLSTGKLASSVE
jgi:hypothetical protein